MTIFIACKIYTLNSSLKSKDEDDNADGDEIFCNKFWQVLINTAYG